MKKLHDRVIFEIISRNDLTEKEKKRSMESLIFLVYNQSSNNKARTVANGGR